MDRKTLTILSGIILLVCFFLPYLKFGYFQLSGYDIVFGPMRSETTAIRFIWLLVPLAAILMLLGAIKGKYFPASPTLIWIPLLTMVFFIIRTYINVKREDFGGNVGPGDFLKMIGYGLWITLITSALLVFGKTKG